MRYAQGACDRIVEPIQWIIYCCTELFSLHGSVKAVALLRTVTLSFIDLNGY